MAVTTRRRVAGGVAVAAVGALALSLAPTPAERSAAAAELPTFGDCAELRDWYARTALPLVTAYGLGGGVGRDLIAVDDGALTAGVPQAARAARAAAPSGAEGSGATGTNLQERGVDEPDVAKTDGRRVVTVRDLRMEVFDVTGSSPRRLGGLRLPVEASAGDLLLVGDRVVVVGTGIRRVAGGGSPGVAEGVPDRSASTMPVPGMTTVRITTVDISDPREPVVVRTEEIEGTLVSARERAGLVRIVVSSTPDLPFLAPTSPGSEPVALEHNRRVVREATAQDWLPGRVLRPGSGTDETRPLLDCRRVRHPVAEAGLGTVSVLTLDPRRPRDLDPIGIAADGQFVYSSADRLYVATSDGGWNRIVPVPLPAPAVTDPGVVLPGPGGPALSRPEPDVATLTRIHAFDVSGRTPRYVASGRVDGLVRDRWAFSEHEGRLRVATTRGKPWAPTDTAVSVLEERAGRLVRVGAVGGLGKGEQVRAVRWFGPLGVVVTFRQIDPLYTLDLSDPTRPRVVGELKIPGFSAYLHPLGGGRLLGIGQDATREGRQTGAQAATYDLTDLARPRRTDTVSLGAMAYSPVENDSRAFTYLPGQRRALVPVNGYDGRSRLAVLAVGADGTLRLVTEEPVLDTAESVRALPVSGDRVAVVAGGEVVRLLDRADLAGRG